MMKNRNKIVMAILPMLACIAFLPQVQAATDVSPPPDGGYPGANTAEGQNALLHRTTGGFNAALGWYSLFSLTTASYNTGVGAGTLALNNADSNTAVGTGALLLNTSGHDNTANGTNALLHNSSGNNNTAVGATALLNNVDGSENTVVGTGAGPNITTGFNNTYLGDFVGSVNPSGTPLPNESNTIRIGDLSNGNGAGSLACFIGGIFNNHQPVGGAVVEVTLDLTNDKLGWDVGPNQGGRAPVQVPQRGVPAPRGPLQPGAHSKDQAMLNNKVEKLQATVAQQQKQIATLTAQLREQAAQIQKVSAQLEVSKPAPQVVTNKP